MLKLPARPLSTSALTVVTWTVSKKFGLSIWSPLVSLGTPSKAYVCLLRSEIPAITMFHPLPWMFGIVVIRANGEG